MGLGAGFRNWCDNPGEFIGHLNQGSSKKGREETKPQSPGHLQSRAFSGLSKLRIGARSEGAIFSSRAHFIWKWKLNLPKLTQQRISFRARNQIRMCLFESTPSPPPPGPPAHLDNFQAGSHGNIIGQDSQIPHAWPIHKTDTGQRDMAGLAP